MFLLLGASIAHAQISHFPNNIVAIPTVPIGSALFTVVVPLEALWTIGDTIVQPNIKPDVAVTHNALPPYGGTIEIRIASDPPGIVLTGQFSDTIGIPILVDVPGSGTYAINYYTKSSSVVDDPYVLRLSSSVNVVAPNNASKRVLENPQPNSYQSGIGLISGWACQPNSLSVRIDNGLPIPIPGGGARADTISACGHAATGFGLLINFNDLKTGQHTIRLESSDPVYAGEAISFRVALPADPSPFISGLSKEVPVPEFPFFGKTTTLIWQQSLQNFSIKATQ